MYVVTGADDVFAINAKTGAKKWTYRAHLNQRIATICCGWDSRGVALGAGKVYVGLSRACASTAPKRFSAAGHGPPRPSPRKSVGTRESAEPAGAPRKIRGCREGRAEGEGPCSATSARASGSRHRAPFVGHLAEVLGFVGGRMERVSNVRDRSPPASSCSGGRESSRPEQKGSSFTGGAVPGTAPRPVGAVSCGRLKLL